MIAGLKKTDATKLEKAIQPNQYTVDESTSKTTYIIVRAATNDRRKVKTAIEKKLRSSGLKFIQKTGGSVGSTQIMFDDMSVNISYKPISGGMSETTLNSTITELAPSIAFASGKFEFDNVNEFYKFISTTDASSVYVNAVDAAAGAKFIQVMPTSSKFNEKMQNAMAVLQFLVDKNTESPIKSVKWGYRSKPTGIPPTHKGDIFLQFADGKYLGVSLKAGGEHTAEPQLNTYVNKFFDDFGKETAKDNLTTNVYNSIHSKLGLDEDWQSIRKKQASLKTISAYKKKYPQKYEDMYDQMLEMIRDSLISTINSDMQGTITYIEKQVLKKDNQVPLLVVKATGKNYKFVTDEDALGAFMPVVTSIKAYASTTSKQNWHIDLIASKNSKITMNMTVRSNKTEPENKVAQGFNLAIKFNGIK